MEVLRAQPPTQSEAYRHETPTTDNAFVACMAITLDRLIAQQPAAQDDYTQFHSLVAPTISICDYIDWISQNVHCSNECFVLSYIYLDRISKLHHEFSISIFNIHRLLVTSIMLAAKFLDDVNCNNAFYAAVGGFQPSEINLLEYQFLSSIDYRLYVAMNEYVVYRQQILLTAAAEIQRPVLSQSLCSGGQGPYEARVGGAHDDPAAKRQLVYGWQRSQLWHTSRSLASKYQAPDHGGASLTQTPGEYFAPSYSMAAAAEPPTSFEPHRLQQQQYVRVRGAQPREGCRTELEVPWVSFQQLACGLFCSLPPVTYTTLTRFQTSLYQALPPAVAQYGNPCLQLHSTTCRCVPFPKQRHHQYHQYHSATAAHQRSSSSSSSSSSSLHDNQHHYPNPLQHYVSLLHPLHLSK